MHTVLLNMCKFFVFDVILVMKAYDDKTSIEKHNF